MNPKNEAAKRFGFRVSGIEPDDPAWPLLGKAQQRAYYEQARTIIASHYDDQLGAGIGRDGQPLARISEYTRKHRRSQVGIADPDAPPLTPAYGVSRTRDYVRTYADDRGVVVYWKYSVHIGFAWGQVLYFHSIGAVRGGKVRDVLGIAPHWLAAIRRDLLAWWKKHRARLLRRAGYDPALIPTGTNRLSPTTRKVIPFDANTIYPDGVPPDPRARYGQFLGAGTEGRTPMVGGDRFVAETRRTGRFSGLFRDFGPDRGFDDLAAFRPAPAPAAPRQAPPLRPQVRRSDVERDVGVRFVQPPAARTGEYVLVIVDVQKVERSLRNQPDYYVGPGGGGPSSRPGAYDAARAFLDRAIQEEIEFHAIRLNLIAGTEDIDIADGRHRFAVLRDRGHKYVVASVDKAEAERIRRLYGP